MLREQPDLPHPAALESLGLTAREADVPRSLTTGATNAQIATALRIAPGTVKKHLDNVYAKLGVHGRVQALSLALELLAADTGMQMHDA